MSGATPEEKVAAVINMDRREISCVRSMARPPQDVHNAFAAFFMLLGYPEKQVMNWRNVIPLLNTAQFADKVNAFQLDTVKPEVLQKVNELIEDMDYSSLACKAQIAAIVFEWVEMVTDTGEQS